MNKLTFLDAYRFNSTIYSTFNFFMDDLIEKGMCAYFNTFATTWDDISEAANFPAEMIELEVDDGEDFKTISLNEIRRDFKSRQVCFDTDNIRRLWTSWTSEVEKYIVSEGKIDPPIDLRNFNVELKDNENSIIRVSNLFVLKESLIKLKIFYNAELKRRVMPSEDFMKVTVILEDDIEAKDDLSENQAKILKALYRGSERQEGFSLSRNEIENLVGRKRDIRPGSIFRFKSIKNYISSFTNSEEQEFIYFNFRK